MMYVKQGLFRMLATIISEEKSDPKFPEIPSLIGLGYKDIPPSRFMLLAPKGLPDPIFNRLEKAFRKAAHSPEFQKVMDNLDLPAAVKDRRQLEAEYPEVSEFYSKLLKDFGILK